jgi:hypothetical protein
MKLEIILNLLRHLFIYFVIGAVCIKVYKRLKTENITFKTYLVRRKSRIFLALFFISLSIGYAVYTISTV